VKKILLLCSFVILFIDYAISQESIFSIGYGINFVSKDSSALTLSIDLNRIPGKPESAGSYFLNEVIKDTKNWGYYFKPTMDINLGNGVSTAPNNISIGTPFGLTFDVHAKNKEKDSYWGLISLFAEASPMIVSDNKLENILAYFTFGPYIRYSYLADKKFILDLQAGITNSNGKRIENYNSTSKFGMVTIPLYVNIKTWGVKSKKNKTDYYRIQLKNTLKNNNIYNDSPNFKTKSYRYYSGKLEFYFCSKFAVNVEYKNGNEEPLFKDNHSLTFGLTLAK
jgi:hypothetical protein